MEEISLIRYLPNQENNAITAQLVECYRNVFADRPWNEWLKCEKCQKYWGTKDQALLASYEFSHCGAPLVDFWPRRKVLADLHHEITPEASCWLAIHDEKVVGFSWGYPMDINDLQAKLGLNLGREIPQRVAYQDEVGVLTSYRGRKIAKAMVARRLSDFVAQGLHFGVVRTRQAPEPSETFLWYTRKLDYKILANYPGDDGRVILGRNLAGLEKLL